VNLQSARIRKFRAWYENSKEYHSLRREIFGENIYYVEPRNKSPLIIDVGAHIGLSVLYFKMLMPKSKILAIEPYADNAKILRKNVELNKLEDVEVLEVAVGKEEGEGSLFIDIDNEWLSSSSFLRGGWNNKQKNREIKVKVVRLGELIKTKVDLLKLDVEGAEEEVLLSLGDKLKMIEHILFEYHPQKNKNPEKIRGNLLNYGFKLKFFKNGKEVDWRKAKGLLIGEAIR
jgi:FkbM family methyltransferase